MRCIKFAILPLSVLLVSCDQSLTDQSTICIYSTDEQAQKTCKEGELSFFKPEQWGNAQLPLSVVAAYCDFNKPVMHTEAGVICTFTKKRIESLFSE